MAKRNVKKSRFTALVGVKASNIRALIRKGNTIGQIAVMYGCSRLTIYRRFGDEIKGLSPMGRRYN